MTASPEDELPPDVAEGSKLIGNEYGWTPALFLKALRNAQSHGLACLGGQFQFRIDGGTYEMYWLQADSTERLPSERWEEYCDRSCAEVLKTFSKLMDQTNFHNEALNWPQL